MPQALALAQSFVHEFELPLRQITKAAVNQFRRSRRRGAREIAAVDQRDSQAAHRRVTRDGRAVDTRADYCEIEFLIAKSRQAFLTIKCRGQRIRPSVLV